MADTSPPVAGAHSHNSGQKGQNKWIMQNIKKKLKIECGPYSNHGGKIQKRWPPSKAFEGTVAFGLWKSIRIPWRVPSAAALCWHTRQLSLCFFRGFMEAVLYCVFLNPEENRNHPGPLHLRSPAWVPPRRESQTNARGSCGMFSVSVCVCVFVFMSCVLIEAWEAFSKAFFVEDTKIVYIRTEIFPSHCL